MKPLLAKELRALRPFGVLFIVLGSLNVLSAMFSDFLDMKSLAHLVNASVRDADADVPAFLAVFALGVGLLVRERDEGTLEFLDALPCGRRDIFLAKLTAGALVAGLLPLTGNIWVLALHALSRDSLDAGFHWGMAGQTFLIEWFGAVVTLTLGLALGFLRRFAFFVLGVLCVGYFVLEHRQVPWIDLLNIFTLTRYDFYGSDVVTPWSRLGVLLALGGGCAALAFLLFRLQGDRTTVLATRLARVPFRGVFVTVGTIAMVGLWIGLFVWMMKDQVPEEDPKAQRVEYRTWEVSRAHAGGYTFLYSADFAERALALARRAEGIHGQVRSFFGAEAPGEIVADLASPLRHGLGGTANWKRVNMNLAMGADADELDAILGHETTHVYIDVLSNSRMSEKFNATRWFHEGLASYVEHRFFRPPEALHKLRRLAAAAHKRKAAEWDDLVDNAGWSLRRDANLAYPLGEVFVAVLVEQHGDTAPAQLLRAAGRKELPENLLGVTLWRDLFQHCGWDLAMTLDGYYARLRSLADGEYREFVESLPRVSGRVRREGERIVIEPVVRGTLPEGCRIVCQLRRQPDDAETDFIQPHREDDLFWAERSALPGGTFWYQLGIKSPLADLPVCEEWQKGNVR